MDLEDKSEDSGTVALSRAANKSEPNLNKSINLITSQPMNEEHLGTSNENSSSTPKSQKLLESASAELERSQNTGLKASTANINTALVEDQLNKIHDHIEQINEEVDSPEVSQESNSLQQSPENQDEEESSTIAKSQIQPQAAIPENILSPPKSETQTDETNTATSSSPGSDSQHSSIAVIAVAKVEVDATPTSAATTEARVSQAINVIANGTIPNSGKPLLSAMNMKLNRSSSRSMRQRKSKPLVAMYESEISDNKIGIKLCIKKSDTASTAATAAAAAEISAQPANVATASKTAVSSKVTTRKRSRKSKSRQHMDSDDSEYETKRKKSGAALNNNAEQRGQKRVAFAASVASDKDIRPVVDQGDWGARMPEELLYKIFQNVVSNEGCLPTLFRIGRICSLWRSVSLRSTLWKTMDLTTCIKEKHRTELKLKWFVDNRCSSCTDLNVSNWKVTDINCFLNKLAVGCPNLVSITLSGWKSLTADHLSFLVDNMKKLERLDLSSINVEMNSVKSAVGLQSLCNALQTIKDRLTHLYLAHNRLAGIPQIVNILSTHCPNLVLLDLSNVHTQATSHGILHIEKLQHGCQKLKVLRVTNSHVTLSTATMQETMDSPGFPNLEELSVAAVTDESRVMGDEHLQRILKTSSKLKLLDVRGCTRLTHESLIRLPAWDIKHLFLSGCSVTRDMGSGLELIASKWAHSLIELDLAWANVQKPLDNALRALAEKGTESPLGHLNLCGSSVSEEAVKDILANCGHMSSINLSSCRGLPRGIKRLMQGPVEIQELRDVLKVQMKVKLPLQLKREQEAAAAVAENKMTLDNGGSGAESGSAVVGLAGIKNSN